MTGKERKIEMQDELTTLMHAEFIEGKLTQLQMRCLGVYGRMAKGLKKSEALEFYHLSDEQYDDNLEATLRA